MKLFRLAAAVGLPIVLAVTLFAQEPPQAPPNESDQGAPPGQAPAPAPPLNPQQLQDLVAPIALYPDTLLSQILVASTYPIEVVEAQQWLQQQRIAETTEADDERLERHRHAQTQRSVRAFGLHRKE